MKKSFLVDRAEGTRPLTESEIAMVAGADEADYLDPFDGPGGSSGWPSTTGVTITSGGRKQDTGAGY